MEGDGDFPLPSLAPHLKLSRAPDDKGEPSYTLHNPSSNSYFKIDWIAFECISRIPLYKTATELKNAIEAETTLKIGKEQIKDIVSFLSKSGLLSLSDQTIAFQGNKSIPIWKKILHQYLFFSIPLFKPQSFLEKTYPRIAWMFNPLFVKSCILFLCAMILMTLSRVDEFFYTFADLFSVQGAIAALLTFAFIKIVHEFAHAYTAVRHGVKVPHMGVAVMLMYPVLYTETTGSWALSSRRARFQIGMAGICAELCLAGFFLLLWHTATPGSLVQSLSFLVVAISLIGSLLINLNPFMRFDGYYMLSDATGFDNLQTRSCNFARHTLRRALFGWNDPAPEDLPDHDKKFLVWFGFGLLIYRLFLFTGIALLVYHLFFQPLGFILMMVELAWFIFLPIWSEIKVWWKNRRRILSAPRALVPAAALLLLLLAFFVPWRTNIILPAIVHAKLQETVYPPSPSRIVALHIAEGMTVEEGDILAELDSPELDFQIKKSRQDLNRLETLKRRGQNMVQTLQNNELSDAAIEKARIKLKGYEDQARRLVITAPFTGIVRDLGAEITEGRYVAPRDALFTLVDPQSAAVSAYATEEEREKISTAETALFFSEYRTLNMPQLTLTHIAETGSTDIPWPELASVYGGPIAADRNDNGELSGRRALYEIVAQSPDAVPHRTERGYLRVEAPASSLFFICFNKVMTLLRREGNV